MRVATGVGTQGQGHYTVFAQIVAEVLGVDVQDVRVVTGDTREFQWGTGTFASRGAAVAGSACHAAALLVRGKILALALAAAGRAGGATRAARTAASRCATRRNAGFALASSPAGPIRCAALCRPASEPGLESTAYFGPDRGSTASGVHAVIVEVDPETAHGRASSATSSCTTAER